MDAGLNNSAALHHKSRRMNWLYCFQGIGAAVGSYVMGLCLTRGSKWNPGYMAVGVIQIALVVCLVLSLPLWRVKTEGNSGQDDAHEQIALREGLRLPGVEAVLTVFFCHCVLGAAADLWVSSYMMLRKRIASRTVAKWALFLYLGTTLGGLISGFVADQARDRNMVCYGQLTAFVGTVPLPPPADDGAVPAGFIMAGLGCVPICLNLLHETPDSFEVQCPRSMMDMQMACIYVGSTLMSPLSRVVAGRISVTLYPVCLMVFVASMIRMIERVGRVQDGRVNGLAYAQLLQW